MIVFFMCFTVVAVVIQSLGESEYVTEPGFNPAAAACYPSACGRAMRVLLRLRETHGPAELLGR